MLFLTYIYTFAPWFPFLSNPFSFPPPQFIWKPAEARHAWTLVSAPVVEDSKIPDPYTPSYILLYNLRFHVFSFLSQNLESDPSPSHSYLYLRPTSHLDPRYVCLIFALEGGPVRLKMTLGPTTSILS